MRSAKTIIGKSIDSMDSSMSDLYGAMSDGEKKLVAYEAAKHDMPISDVVRFVHVWGWEEMHAAHDPGYPSREEMGYRYPRRVYELYEYSDDFTEYRRVVVETASKSAAKIESALLDKFARKYKDNPRDSRIRCIKGSWMKGDPLLSEMVETRQLLP